MKNLTFFLLSVLVYANSTKLFAQSIPSAMQRAVLDGVELEYEVQGTGEPVMLVHAGVFADWFKPLMKESALMSRFRVVRYHRVGYAGSSRLTGPVSLVQQADHLRLLMQKLGIKKAHLVGHSSSGNIVMQLAFDSPQSVQSLALLEPALRVEKGAAERAKAFEVVYEHYRRGDKTASVDAFMQTVTGPGYRATLDKKLPGAFERGVTDADTFFGQELPALREWVFTREDAHRIKHPVLAVIGEKSKQQLVWQERQQMLVTWLPNVEPFELPNATHLLHVDNPNGMAEALAAFFARHPMTESP